MSITSKQLGAIKNYLSSLAGTEAMDELEANQVLKFTAGDMEVVFAKEDLLIEMTQSEGYVSQNDHGITVVLDTNLTPELLEEGFVREIISKVQTMRKEAGFEVMDKIVLYVDKNEMVSDIIQKNREEIQSEVLANNVIFGKINGYHKEWNINGENVELGVEKQ